MPFGHAIYVVTPVVFQLTGGSNLSDMMDKDQNCFDLSTAPGRQQVSSIVILLEFDVATAQEVG